MRVPFAKLKAPYAAPATGLAPACSNCGTRLAVGQDWCLECGTAVPGRYGRGPGLRSSLGVVGVTLLLVIGAVAAAYAALSSDSRKATQTTANVPAVVAPPSATGVPDTAAVPGAVPGAPPGAVPAPGAVPGIVAPGQAAAPKLPAATPTPAPAPVTAAPKTTLAAPKATTPTTAPKPTPKTAPAPAGAALDAKSAKILLDTDAASSYNPYGLPNASFTDPARAIDGDPATSWTYQLDPGTMGKTQVGLALNLKAAQRVRALTITATAGMTVEFYGATGAQPVSITDPAWLHLANRRPLKASSTVTLSTKGRALDYLLVWITHAPTGQVSGTLGISEVSVSS